MEDNRTQSHSRPHPLQHVAISKSRHSDAHRHHHNHNRQNNNTNTNHNSALSLHSDSNKMVASNDDEIPDTSGWIKIELVCINPKYQGQQLGSLLLAAALAFAVVQVLYSDPPFLHHHLDLPLP